MATPLRVLIVEDQEADAELLLRELRRGGFEVSHQRVETAEAMTAALRGRTWDIVISDYSMPHFSGPKALALLKAHEIDIPFIIVSGTIGEDVAVDAIRAGAHDFMTKGRFARLRPAIERELRDAAVRVERTKLREQLAIADRMVSVGTLAAGVAHEINNPLAALMANVACASQDLATLGQELRGRGADGDGALAARTADRLKEIEEPLNDARECAERVRLIVRDLKLFSRVDEEKRDAVDVRRVIESCIRMAWNEIRHRARLVKDYKTEALVEGNESRLGQVFLNLLINAAQAIPEGQAQKNVIRVETQPAGDDRIAIVITDTGAGIPEPMLARIFDPFFTTKPIGVGTGLGLAICHRIITSLGGEILVASEVGRGTTVRTLLPIAKAVPEKAPAPVPVTAPIAKGRILVVDDEPMLGTAIRRMLSNEHDVEVVTSAADALGRIAAGARYDVILSDLMMPDMTGMDLHAELAKLAPEQLGSMVFMTGGAFTPRAREFLDQTPNPRIEKPFDAANLRTLVRSVMRQK